MQKLSLQEKHMRQQTVELESKQTRIVQLEGQVSQLNSKLEDLQQERQSQNIQYSTELQNLQEHLESLRLLVNRKEAELNEMTATMSYLNTDMMEQHEVTREKDRNEFKSKLAAKDSHIQELRESLSSKDEEIQSLQQQIQMLKTLPKITTPPFRPFDYLLGKQMKISWSDGICPPCQFDATVSQVVFHDNRVCVSISDPRQDTTAVWEYDLNCWKEHPCVIASQCSIVFLRERLAAVGGHYCASVLCLTHSEWRPSFPLMTIARALPSCAFANPHLLVAGGEDRKGATNCNDIEILNIDSGSWQMVRPFPIIFGMFKRLSVFAIQNSFYFVGGYDGNCQNKKLFECSLSGLIDKRGENPWKELPSSSRIGAAFAAVNGQLLSLGGCKDYLSDPSAEILSFNCKNKEWDLVGILRRNLKHGLIGAVTADDKKPALVVIGKDYTDVGQLV